MYHQKQKLLNLVEKDHKIEALGIIPDGFLIFIGFDFPFFL
jgi:hypothetical protein